MTNKNESPRIALLTSQVNYDHTYLMEMRAAEHAEFLGCEIVEKAYAPGAYDMPIILKTLLQREDIDAVVTLGTIVKGETDHDKLIANQVARKITDLSLEFNKPIGLGISGPGVSMMGSKARIDKFATSAVTSAVKMWKELNRIQK